METWRDRGFVPDSDEEDDFDIQDSRWQTNTKTSNLNGYTPSNIVYVTTPTNDQHAVPSATQSQQFPQSMELASDDELNESVLSSKETDAEKAKSLPLTKTSSRNNTARSGPSAHDESGSSEDELQRGHDPVPRPPHSLLPTNIPSQAVLPVDDDSLSSLSPPPSSLESLHSSTENKDDGQRLNAQVAVDNLEDMLPPLETPEETWLELSEPTRRSLRQRNPIQLHPYLLEDAKYQSLLKGRGIRPVRLPTAHKPSLGEGQESQEKEFIDTPEISLSSPPTELRFPPSPPNQLELPTNIQHRTPRSLPNSTPVRNDGPTQKRRKLFHRNEKTDHLQPSPSTMQVVIDNTPTVSKPQSQLTTDGPPSPPRSGSLSSTETNNKGGFRFPRGFTPPPLTAPITNSNSISHETEDLRTQGWPGDDEPMSNVESISETGEARDQHLIDGVDHEVKLLRRKIKGVLPASWLRLDLKQQDEKQIKLSQRQRNYHGNIAEPVKGVARKVTRATNSSVASPMPRTSLFLTLTSSDSESSSSDAGTSREALAGLLGFDYPFDDMRNADIPEDNRIDYMFPPAPKVYTPGTRNSRVKSSRTPREKEVEKRRYRQRQARITDIVSRERPKSKSAKPPKLGILDAPDVAQQNRQDQPQFLRVAARQARSKRNHGRKSPDQKFFRMVTRDDTEEVNQSLKDWRKGTIKQTKSPASRTKPQRAPLSGVTANKQSSNTRLLEGSRNEKSGVDSRSKWLEDLDSNYDDNLPVDIPKRSMEAEGLRSAPIAKPKEPMKYGNKWLVPRSFAVSSLKRNGPRPAEFAEVSSRNDRSPLLFRKSLEALSNSKYQHSHGALGFRPSLTLDRFLSGGTPGPPRPELALEVPTHPGIKLPVQRRIHKTKRLLKKRPPTHFNVNEADDQSASGTPEAISVSSIEEDQSTSSALQGLGGVRNFSIDFDVSPLRVGTFFHDSTFIGEGAFSRSLEIEKRHLDEPCGLSFIHLGQHSFRWGPWNDSVSSELGLIFDVIIGDLNQHDHEAQELSLHTRAIPAFESVLRYVNDKLSFTDPIDRKGFVDRSMFLCSKLSDHFATLASRAQGTSKRYQRLASFNLVFANQIQQIASHQLVEPSKWNESLNIVKIVSQQVLALVFSKHGLSQIRHFLEDNKPSKRREIGIRDDYPSVEAYVMIFHILHSTGAFKGWFADLTVSLGGDVSSITDIQPLEDIWRALYTTLPLNEIDRYGIGQTGARYQSLYHNWPLVVRLVSRVLDAYRSDSATHAASFNNYCRSLFHRCFRLMNSWGWRDCKVILDTLFDFFAKNMLYNLKNEETFGSPSFLDNLESNPSLDIQPGDSCFHILLKVIGSGLRFLSDIYDKKKIRNYAWRLLPNHGRVYPKDRPLQHEDLDALRNHHDLLCTLFWAVPDGCQPRIETIRNLVDPATSHQETCNLSIRSWSRLVRFKLSTNGDISGLGPFSEWHGQFLSELARQHSLARTEVESQADGNLRFSRQLVESTISQNQRQIESLISSALAGMKKAVENTRSQEQANVLVSSLPIAKLLGLFNPKSTRVNGIVKEALEVVMALFGKDDSAATARTHSNANDDSQEYGDWTGIEDMCDDVQEPPKPSVAVLFIQNAIQPAVSRLVSDCFGEDNSPEDEILFAAVECWCSLARILVKHGLQHWDSYLSPYGSHSWTTLRTTVQTRKFTPQFLASCIEKDSRFCYECKPQLLNMWMSCLVERTSMLKLQHRLTEALLNENSESPLFRNLPFYRDRKEDRYLINLADFRDRRLSLMSSLLSNMREHLQVLEDSGDRGLSAVREEYRELLMSLMTSMKANYQELGHVGASVQGAYVGFVHRIVGFMQQHTQNICPIDKYFTDPTSFPLPADDPAYIVARLKAYGVRLSAGKVAKQLVMFIQSVSERAAVDGQQSYLIDQLFACMADTYETGDDKRPTLRSFLIRCIFPAYIECCFSNSAVWILTWPISRTVSRTFADLLYDIDVTDRSCTSSVVKIFRAIFGSMCQAMRLLIDHPGFLDESPVLVTLTSFLEAITSALPAIEYLHRNYALAPDIIGVLRLLQRYTTFAIATLVEPSMAIDPEVDDEMREISHVTYASENTTTENAQFFEEARVFAARELQTWLRTSWSRHDNRYFLRRGQQSKEIEDGIVSVKEIGDVAAAKAAYFDAAEVFFGKLRRLDIFDEMDADSTFSCRQSTYDLDEIGDEIATLML